MGQSMPIRAKVIVLSSREARILYQSKQLADGYATREELADCTLTVYKIQNVPGYRIKRELGHNPLT